MTRTVVWSVQALDMLKTLSGDAETRHRALVRERALHDERIANSGG